MKSILLKWVSKKGYRTLRSLVGGRAANQPRLLLLPLPKFCPEEEVTYPSCTYSHGAVRQRMSFRLLHSQDEVPLKTIQCLPLWLDAHHTNSWLVIEFLGRLAKESCPGDPASNTLSWRIALPTGSSINQRLASTSASCKPRSHVLCEPDQF